MRLLVFIVLMSALAYIFASATIEKRHAAMEAQEKYCRTIGSDGGLPPFRLECKKIVQEMGDD